MTYYLYKIRPLYYYILYYCSFITLIVSLYLGLICYIRLMNIVAVLSTISLVSVALFIFPRKSCGKQKMITAIER